MVDDNNEWMLNDVVAMPIAHSFPVFWFFGKMELNVFFCYINNEIIRTISFVKFFSFFLIKNLKKKWEKRIWENERESEKGKANRKFS